MTTRAYGTTHEVVVGEAAGVCKRGQVTEKIGRRSGGRMASCNDSVSRGLKVGWCWATTIE